jgi:hypothetical protein
MYKIVTVSYYNANTDSLLDDYPQARVSEGDVEVVVSCEDGNLTKDEALAHIALNWLTEPPLPDD